jgi:alkylation response protein AidB-like acyl-CoA dehydrogenase
MSNTSKLVGGSFLFANTPTKDVFIPEEFTQEQHMIFNTVKDFMLQEVHGLGIGRVASLDAEKDRELVLDIFKKASELGLSGVSIDEQFGGLGLDFNTSLYYTEGLGTWLFFCYHHRLSNVYWFVAYSMVWHRSAKSKIFTQNCQR